MTDNDPFIERHDANPELVATAREFGHELTLVRLRAGMTVRDVARATGLPVSTVGDYFSGSHLPPPSQAGLLLRLLQACGETDPARLAKWIGALSRARRPPGKRAVQAKPPYRGLASFEREDAAWFFGRAEVTERLVDLATRAPEASGVPVTVVGPSGSGKSSLLRAGLVPRLLGDAAGDRAGPDGASGFGPFLLVIPSARPISRLAVQLSELAAPRPDDALAPDEIEVMLRRDPASAANLPLPARPGRPVIVADQFEAIFTDCPDERERELFISVVCQLCGPAIVAVGLRADFYDRALRYPDLARALQDRQIVCRPMNQDELRCAIIEPARKAGLDVEDGLVEILLRDLAPGSGARSLPGAGHEAGALPLLSHTLLATWKNSRGGRITVADYQVTGGIRNAIAQTAENAYAGLSDDEEKMTRRLFLRLVHVADDAPETRAVLQLGELLDDPADDAVADRTLGRFVADRLITLDAGTARITHEALLTAWPRLREWIDADEENLRAGRRISQAARVWEEGGRDSASLLRGGQLGLARDWIAQAGNRASLSRLARDFVESSIAQDERHQQAERSRARRLRRLVAALVALVLATCGLTAYSLLQRMAADAARVSATAARDEAESREVAVEASQIRGQNVTLAAQLGLAAYRIADTAEARSSLLESSGMPAAAQLVDSSGVVQAVALSPNHRLLAVAAADGTLRLWNMSRPGHPVPAGPSLVPLSGAPLYAVAFSPDGETLAAAGAGKTVTLWHVGPSGRPVRLGPVLTGPASTIYTLAFGLGGQVLAAGSADGTVRLWTVTGPLRPAPVATLAAQDGAVQSVAFSPGATMLAAGGTGDDVALWDVSDPARPVALGQPLTGPAGPVYSVAFSPDGRLLAAGSQDKKVWLWNVNSAGRPVPAGPPLTGATDWVNAVAFSPDGASLAAGSSDGDVRVWQVAGWRLKAVLPHPQPVTSLAWDGTGYLISADADGTVRAWLLPPPVLLTSGPVADIAYSPGGNVLAVAGPDLELWNTTTRTLEAARTVPGTTVYAVAFAPHAQILAAGYASGMVQIWSWAGGSLTPAGAPFPGSAGSPSESVAFSPDGQILAEGGNDGMIRLWALPDPAHPRPLAAIPDSGIYYVFSVAFSPDGGMLAAASSDGLTRLWRITSPTRPQLTAPPLAGPTSYALSVAFSPNGRVLAVGSADKSVRLWNVSNPERPVRLGQPLTGPAGYFYSIAFSPGGRTLAAGATDGTVWIWSTANPADPALLATLTSPGTQVFAVAFGADGQSLAAGGADGTVQIWDTQVGSAANEVCQVTGQPITRSEWAASVPGLPYRSPCPG
jgi:WD40 repeat protein/transcriptional regulator with XRE-family HTH domain